jgi:hypothetical protein
MAIFSQTFVIQSSLPAQEAWKQLLPAVRTSFILCSQCGQILPGHFCSHCGQPGPPPLPLTRFEFEGDLSPRDFNISRIINYRNSCIPDIRGRFEPTATGTRIVIEMKMNPLGYVFLVGGIAVPFIVLSALAAAGQGSPFTAIGALAIPCFMFAICWIAFSAEAGTARVALSRLWQ